MSLLAQLQLTDSAFPSGLYTLSHGLEAYAQAGPVDVAALLEDVLLHSAGPGDATALVLTHRAVTAGDWDTVVEVDRRLHALKLNREIRSAATRTGNQVLRTAALVFATPELARLAGLVEAKATPGNHAVVMGAAHAGLGVPVDRAVTCDLFAFAASWVSAAVRLRRLDFRQAQTTLHGAADAIGRAAGHALAARGPLDLHAATPVADTMSAAHERAAARLFTT
ncbi:urease accessory protein UreF [Sphaerisporangium krabiense]|uniref:Urease accessory protein UreF n=1 Tax=Sphaerisporangium krabiense TaxID=763782 RepID=A0A7W9DRT8_9ACTN|nr:urease accessory UreF family protein [Sphaerisporangium krabiense]MBB5628987.1 urease accessory protein [Sphaerisporangium krabiense]GII60173.1 urease accessory protein UreF [Sphaerisporangium krabiense]